MPVYSETTLLPGAVTAGWRRTQPETSETRIPLSLSFCRRIARLSVIFAALLVLAPTVAALAQGRASIWYFGRNAGLDFRSGAPTALPDGQINTHEGSAVMCDDAGNLLFYTDGTQVWNRQHERMPDGNNMGGGISATQSALIIPAPGSTDRYYLFTISHYTAGIVPSLSYGIIDMAEEGGLGKVVLPARVLQDSLAERLTAVPHAGGSEYWILTQAVDAERFFAFRVGAVGIDPQPVISEVEAAPRQTSTSALGYLKASPDGKKLAVAQMGVRDAGGAYEGGVVEVFDFDDQTGRVRNAFRLADYNGQWIYGVEFSPGNRYLYVSSATRIDQYDLNAGSPAEIGASRYSIDIIGQGRPFAMQTGPDGKIYVVLSGRDYLAVINDPNTGGAGCNFQEKGPELDGRRTVFGLPNFVPALVFRPIDFTYITGCPGDTVTFTLSVPDGEVEWDFGDPNSGDANSSTERNPMHLFSGPGEYVVTLRYQGPVVGDIILRKTVRIDAPLAVTVSNDSTICRGESVQLRVAPEGFGADARIEWSPAADLSDASSLAPIARPTQTRVYTVTVSTPEGCSASARVRISVVDDDVIVARLIAPGEELLPGDKADVQLLWDFIPTEVSLSRFVLDIAYDAKSLGLKEEDISGTNGMESWSFSLRDDPQNNSLQIIGTGTVEGGTPIVQLPFTVFLSSADSLVAPLSVRTIAADFSLNCFDLQSEDAVLMLSEYCLRDRRPIIFGTRQYSLSAAYPNPGRGLMTIDYTIGIADNARLELFTMMGDRVAILADGFHDAGAYQRTTAGLNLARGVYFYRLSSGPFSAVRALLIE